MKKRLPPGIAAPTAGRKPPAEQTTRGEVIIPRLLRKNLSRASPAGGKNHDNDQEALFCARKRIWRRRLPAGDGRGDKERLRRRLLRYSGLGTGPTWNDIHAALYWGDDNIGESLEWEDSRAHDARTAPWRVEVRSGMSGRVNYLVRVRDEAAEKYGGAGKVTASLHISCAGKLNRGVRTLSLADWYVLLKTVPSLSWEEIEAAYAHCPPRELDPVPTDVWNAPGSEPWGDEESD